MTIQELQRQALRKGLQLRPMSPSVRETLQDLRDGRRRATSVAAHRLIMKTAASNRLAALATLGLAEAEEEGREKIYTRTADGRAASAALP